MILPFECYVEFFKTINRNILSKIHKLKVKFGLLLAMTGIDVHIFYTYFAHSHVKVNHIAMFVFLVTTVFEISYGRYKNEASNNEISEMSQR